MHFKKVIRMIIITLIVITLFSFIFISFYPIARLNHPNTICYRNENNDFEIEEINNISSRYTSINNISKPLINTLITIEDQSFYSHNGLDYKRIFKSLFTNLKEAEIIEGASTLTQQLSRIAFLNNDQSLERKIKEAIISKKIEGRYTKDEILEFYFNLVYFGHNLYGIYSATNYYFNKLPSDIDYSEASILVGIINSPNKYAPDINKELCLKKQTQILSLLLKRNILNKEEYQKALKKDIKFTFSLKENNDFQYYKDAIIKEIKNKNLYSKIPQEGLKITTYYDQNVQNLISTVIQKYQSKFKENEEISIVIMKPYSNKVIALTGGISYTKSPFNRAIDSKRQIGSTIKPLLYYLALQNGFNYNNKFTSQETIFKIDGLEEYSPKNPNNKYANRKINLLEAISTSDNIYAMKTLLFLGKNTFKKHLEKYDIQFEANYPPIALGTLELSPLELCSIYNSFASEGIYYKPSLIKQITDYNNHKSYKDAQESKRVMLKNKVIEMNYLLKSPFDKVFSSYALPSLLHYPTKATFSAKTGTTDSSTWVCGFNKKYTICVYLGTDDNSYLSQTKIAKSIFQDLANLLCPVDYEFYRIPNNYETFSLINKATNETSFSYIREKKLFA